MIEEKRHLYEYNYDMPETSGIYEILNNIDHKGYVGQAKFLPGRAVLLFHEHCIPLMRAYEKYGIENFSVILLEECPIDMLDEREIYWISELHTHVKSSPCRGYNLTTGGKGVRGLVASKELRESRSKRMIGNKLNLGRVPTDTARAHMSASAPRVHSAEHNMNVSRSLKSKGIKPSREALENSARTNREKLRGNKRLLGKRFINNGVVTKAVDESLLDEYLTNGWSLGRK